MTICYPQVSFRQAQKRYLWEIYRKVSNVKNGGMDRNAARRRLYVQYLNRFFPGRGGIVRLAKALAEKQTPISESYLRRMKSEPEKDGHKNIGEDTIEKLEGVMPECKDWFTPALRELSAIDAASLRDADHGNTSKGGDLSPSDDAPRGRQDAASTTAQEPSYVWPFANVEQRRYDDLNDEGKQHVEFALQVAIATAEARGLVDTSRSKRSA
jgi:hypothetical protein